VGDLRIAPKPLRLGYPFFSVPLVSTAPVSSPTCRGTPKKSGPSTTLKGLYRSLPHTFDCLPPSFNPPPFWRPTLLCKSWSRRPPLTFSILKGPSCTPTFPPQAIISLYRLIILVSKHGFLFNCMSLSVTFFRTPLPPEKLQAGEKAHPGEACPPFFPPYTFLPIAEVSGCFSIVFPWQITCLSSIGIDLHRPYIVFILLPGHPLAYICCLLFAWRTPLRWWYPRESTTNTMSLPPLSPL